MPLKKLDFELRKFSTRSLARGGSVQFQAVLEPGPVSLPRHVRSSSLVGGIAKATAAALKGAKESAEREERPLFSSITLAGRIAPLPAPTGWVTLDVSEFELTGVRGLASQQGIEIGDGLLVLLHAVVAVAAQRIDLCRVGTGFFQQPSEGRSGVAAGL